MAIDDRFQVAPEVSVERHGRAVGFRQRDGFREQTARMRLRRPQHGHGPRVIFDDDFRARANVSQQRRNVGCGGFCFRDVDHIFSHLAIIHRTSSLWTARSPYKSTRSRRQYERVSAPTVHITVWDDVSLATPRAKHGSSSRSPARGVNHSPTGPQAAFVRGKSPLVAKFLQRDQRLIPDLFKLTLLQLLKPINGNPT